MGLILSEDDHKAENGNQVFDQANGAIKAYNSLVRENDNNAVSLHRVR